MCLGIVNCFELVFAGGKVAPSPAVSVCDRQMYSASGAVRSAVADQQIGDDAVTRRRRLVGRRRAGTAALDHVDSYIMTLSLYMTRSGTSSQCSLV